MTLEPAHLFGLGGGVAIGLASLIASGTLGKTPGISGVFSRALQLRRGDTAWRFIFLTGLIAGATLVFVFGAEFTEYHPVRSLVAVAIAGLLVGVGTRVGGGCTSGHGVCGIGLGARDSIVATLVFMATGMATVFVISRVFPEVLP